MILDFLEGFDSKLVRLKGFLVEYLQWHRGEFRFQTGSIKRPRRLCLRLPCLTFRFQTGSIKSNR